MKQTLDIQTIISYLLDESIGLHKSLQKEFEFLLSSNTPEFVLQSKKRQIQSLNFIINQIGTISECTDKINQQITDDKFKIKSFLEQYGILPFELYLFLGASKQFIENQTDYFKTENIFKQPDCMRLKDSEPNKEIKLATKPVFDFNTLTKLAKQI